MIQLKQPAQKAALIAFLGVFGGTGLGIAPAAAADSVSIGVSRVYVCEANAGECELGEIQILEGADYTGAISSAGEMIEITLPAGVSFRQSAYRKAGWTTPTRTYKNMQLDFSGDQTVTVTLFGDNKGIYKDSFALPLYVDLEDAAEGDLYFNIDGLKSQIDSQKVQFARVSDKGITAECVRDFSIGAEEDGYFIVRLTEKVAGSIDLDQSTIRLTLPDGFSFNTAGKEGNVKGIQVNGVGAFQGTQSLNDSKIKDNKLTFSMKDLTQLVRSNEDSRGILEICANVTTDATVKSGAVTLQVTGNRDIEDTEVVVGQIGDFQVYTSVTETPNVLSGGVGQKLGTLVITEEVPGSLVAGENIRITFPKEVKLAGPYDIKDVKVAKGDAVLALVSSDENKVTFKVTKVTSGGETRIEIPFDCVNIQPGFTGDISIEMDGRAGVKGDLVLGKAIAPVEVSVGQVSQLEAGKQDQALGTITVKENQGGALKQGQELVLIFPQGIQLQPGARVEVMDGNAEVDSVKVIESTSLYQNAKLSFRIKNESSSQRPSVIKISNLQVTVGSLNNDGDVTLTLSGGAIVQSNETAWIGSDAIWNYHDYPVDAFQSQDQFRKSAPDYLFNQTSAGEITVAKCVTAPEEISEHSVFKVDSSAGSIEVTIRGEKQIMPVAPYIQNGRTMLPVRYVAYACGVSPENVKWDADTQTVILTEGSREVKLVIGQKTLVVDGDMVQTMDVAPEITNGYTFLPARYVAEAFGYSVGWNADTQTVTIDK